MPHPTLGPDWSPQQSPLPAGPWLVGPARKERPPHLHDEVWSGRSAPWRMPGACSLGCRLAAPSISALSLSRGAAAPPAAAEPAVSHGRCRAQPEPSRLWGRTEAAGCRPWPPPGLPPQALPAPPPASPPRKPRPGPPTVLYRDQGAGDGCAHVDTHDDGHRGPTVSTGGAARQLAAATPPPSREGVGTHAGGHHADHDGRGC